MTRKSEPPVSSSGPWSDDQLDQLLSGPRIPGPKLDELWEKLTPRLEPEPPPQRSWWRGWRRFWVLLPTAALAGWVGFLVRPELSSGGYRARGGGAEPRLEATCGAAARPCRVGAPVHLRAHHLRADQRYEVLLVSGTTRIRLAGPLSGSEGSLPLSVELIPEQGDEERGLELELSWEGGQTRLHLQVKGGPG